MSAKSERKKQAKAAKAEVQRIGEVVAKGEITKAQVEQIVHGIIKLGGHAASAVGFMKPIENSEGPYPAGRYRVFKVDPAGQLVFVDLTNSL